MSKHLNINENWKISENNYSCPYCNKIYTRKGICTHILRSHLNYNFSNGNHGKYNTQKFKNKISKKMIEINNKNRQ